MYQPRLKLLGGTIINLFIIIIFSCTLSYDKFHLENFIRSWDEQYVWRSRYSVLDSYIVCRFGRIAWNSMIFSTIFFFIGNSFPFLTFKTTANICTTVVVVGDWLLIRHGDTELKGRENVIFISCICIAARQENDRN